MLKSRIEELDRSDYNVAQTLLVLQLLSKSPEKSLPWKPKLDTKSPVIPSDVGILNEILEKDPLPLDADHWKIDLTEFSEDSLSLSEEEERITDSKHWVAKNPNKRTRIDNSDFMNAAQLNESLSLVDEEFQMFLQVNDTQLNPNDQQISQANQEAQLAAQYDKLYDSAYWNHILDLSTSEDDQTTVIPEHTIVREIIFALKGRPSAIFSSVTGEVIDTISISSLSKQISLDILGFFKKHIDQIELIRKYFSYPGTQLAPLSIFGAAIEKHILKPLDELLDGIVNKMTTKETSAKFIVSVLSFQSQIKRISYPWNYILPTISTVLEFSPGQEDTKFSFIINELYTACNKAYSAIISSSGQEVNKKTSNSAYGFNQLILIFQEMFKNYGMVCDDWMRLGTISPEDLFLLKKNNGLSSSSQYFWKSKYSGDFSKIPPFLSDVLCQQMYEAGMSILLYYNINNKHENTTSIELQKYSNHLVDTRLLSKSCFEDLFFGQSKEHNFSETALVQQLLTSPTQIWWSKFQSNLERWVHYYYEFNTRLLQVRLFDHDIDENTGNLQQFLAQYISTYFMQDVVYKARTPYEVNYGRNFLFSSSLVSSDFCTELFPKFEKFWFPGNYPSNQPGGLIQQPDKYTVQDDFEESIKRNMDIESAYIPKLVFLSPPNSKGSFGLNHSTESSRRASSIYETTKTNSRDLDYMMSIKLAYPTPWIVREIIRDHSSVYQEIWIQLLQWAWARYIVGKLHQANMKQLSLVLSTNESDMELVEQLKSQCLTTHTVLTFINNLSVYFRDSALSISSTKFLNAIAPSLSGNQGSTSNLGYRQNPSSQAIRVGTRLSSARQAGLPPQESYHSFQSIINHHDQFIKSVCDLCFLTPKNAESCNGKPQNPIFGQNNAKSSSFNRSNTNLVYQHKHMDIDETQQDEIASMSSGRGLYIRNIQQAVGDILEYCTFTLLQDRNSLRYTSIEYFEGLVKALKRSISLGLNNCCFGENADHVERFLHCL